MKQVFGGGLVALVLMSLAAWGLQPRLAEEGKTPLVWVSDDNPARREQIALFNRLHPQYHLGLDPTNRDMAKVIVQCIGGVGPDLFDCYDVFQLSAFVRSGIAWDVTEELEAAGIDVRRDFWKVGLPLMVYEGRVYGVLNNASVNAIWFNKDIFDEHGIPYPEGPWTWEEFIPLAKQLTVYRPDGRIKHFGFMFAWWNWRHFLVQWGGRVYTEDGTRCVLDSPEAIAAIQFMQDLIYKHHVAPTPAEEAATPIQGGWGSGDIKFLGAGKTAMALGGRWWLCNLRKYEGLRLGAVESPHGPYRTYRGYGRSTLINKNSPRRAEALAFLKYLASREFSELINHQADALAPVKRYCYTEQYLHDPDFPNEDFNAMWRDVMQFGVPDRDSPFINGNAAGRIITKQLDLVKANEKPAADAMETAAREINEEIHKTLRRNPSLRRRYEELTGQRVQ
ncbi:MAG: ABC transporter substrate-binding protein [Candidatus Brocadiia bacterium]